MLSPNYVPGPEFHVFDGQHWLYSVASLKLRIVDGPERETVLPQQFCFRSPVVSHGAFDIRDVKGLEPGIAHDQHLRVARLVRNLMKSLGSAQQVTKSIEPMLRSLDRTVRQVAAPSPDCHLADLEPPHDASARRLLSQPRD